MRLRSGAARLFLRPQDIAAFIEPHIEQGPELIDRAAPVGIVTGIRGSFRYRTARALGPTLIPARRRGGCARTP